MMQQLSLKHRLNNGDSVYGIFNSIPDPLIYRGYRSKAGMTLL